MAREEADNVRTHILNEAIRVLGHKGIEHGSAEQTYRFCAQLWGAYLGIKMDASDVINLMALLKMARSRLGDSTNLDHYVDQCGYIAIAGEMALKKSPTTGGS